MTTDIRIRVGAAGATRARQHARNAAHSPSLLLGVRLGLLQAGIELRDKVRRWTTLSFLIPPAVVYYVLTEQNGAAWIGGVDAARTMWAAYPVTALSITGIVTYSSTVMAEQDDGIVLRAKTLPHGVRGYIVGKAVSLALLSLASIVLVVGAAQLAIGGIVPHELWRLVPLMALLVLTIAATTPLGVILGGLARGPMASVPVSVAAFSLIGISGIFIPLTVMPGWAQGVAKVFPVTGLGELSRWCLGLTTPTDTVQVAMALAAPVLWAVLGLTLMPRALAVMSRRQSGSRMEQVEARRAARGF